MMKNNERLEQTSLLFLGFVRLLFPDSIGIGQLPHV